MTAAYFILVNVFLSSLQRVACANVAVEVSRAGIVQLPVPNSKDAISPERLDAISSVSRSTRANGAVQVQASDSLTESEHTAGSFEVDSASHGRHARARTLIRSSKKDVVYVPALDRDGKAILVTRFAQREKRKNPAIPPFARPRRRSWLRDRLPFQPLQNNVTSAGERSSLIQSHRRDQTMLETSIPSARLHVICAVSIVLLFGCCYSLSKVRHH
eukprot:TRINITY_DN75835_c0_g1_i1.p1 TRINITY_DN75835_c0_g1~~TRINITY_DN75835_c0_g1_i1.p1  ORF type:complete len:216 (+),score=10.49 TRINITY_DN75835_c0_g1_i1:71-718(+)